MANTPRQRPRLYLVRCPVEKKAYQSKTLCVAGLALLGNLLARWSPEVGQFVKDNAIDLCAALPVMFAGLRMLTDGKVRL